MFDPGYKNIFNKYFSNRPEVLCVYLFGSAAKEKENVYSDIDVAILYNNSIPSKEYTDRQITLSIELGQLLGREVDVIILNHTAPYLKFQVIKEGIRVYESPARKDRAFEAHSIIDYFDFLPVKNLLESSIIKRIKGDLLKW